MAPVLKRSVLALAILFLFLFSTTSSVLAKQEDISRRQIQENFGKVPLSFEVNKGQVNPSIEFLSRGSGYSLFLTPTESVLALSQSDNKSSVVRMGLAGANHWAKVSGVELLKGKTNYLIGSDKNQWKTGIPNYKKVQYEAVYPGIDLVYYGNQRKLEYDFIVQPGADPENIRLKFSGVEGYSIESGDLVLRTDGGQVIQQAPIIYQQVDGKRKKVEGNYKFLDEGLVAFHLGDYDKTKTLVIDPVLHFSTYLGGSEWEKVSGIDVGADGSVYITGNTISGDFPLAPDCAAPSAPPDCESPFSTIPSSVGEAFIAKFDPSGSTLIYSTYLATGRSQGNDLKVDAEGNAIVTGIAHWGLPPVNSIPDEFAPRNEAGRPIGFISKLNADGSDLIYSSRIGNVGRAVALDSEGNAYVTGEVGDCIEGCIQGINYIFPATGYASPSMVAGIDITGDRVFRGDTSVNVFVAKLKPNGDLGYVAKIGSLCLDRGFGIAVDSVGAAYVTGQFCSDPNLSDSPDR